MSDRRTALTALRALREHERTAARGWVLDSDLASEQKRAVNAAAAQGLVTLADRGDRAELSACKGRPVLWAARLSPVGHDVLAYAEASPPSVPIPDQPGPGEQLVELRPAQMNALRVYVSLGDRLRVPPARELAERVRTARYSGPDNRWRLHLTPQQIESVAYAFHLRSVAGSAAEANEFARNYRVIYRPDDTTGQTQLVTLT
ncbi:DUF6417 family protein [Streptomyces sp. NPDC003362]